MPILTMAKGNCTGILQNSKLETVIDSTMASDDPVPVSGPIPSKLFASLQEGVMPTLTPVVNMAESLPKRTIPGCPKGYRSNGT